MRLLILRLLLIALTAFNLVQDSLHHNHGAAAICAAVIVIWVWIILRDRKQNKLKALAAKEPVKQDAN